ncbi:MAG: DUF1844 domain-containing protein [Candidatus Bathyarchaeia archaeon]|jgi:hypothetical protein
MSEGKDAEETRQPEMVDIASLDVYSLLGLFVGIVAEKARQTLGLRTKPGTDKVETDFDQARVAIDTVGFFAEKLRLRMSEDEKRRLEGLVADLKLNYVRLTKT